MDCDVVRSAISAALDGEDTGMLPPSVDAHLSACHACRSFAVDAADLHRALRVSAAEPVPDLTAAILSSIESARPRARVERSPSEQRVRVLRVCLALVGTLQLALALPVLVLGADAGLPVHSARHIGSFTVALAVGLLVVAWQPARAVGLLPVIAVLVACLVGSAVLDAVAGRAVAGAELGHAPEVTGLVAVWLLARAEGLTHGRRSVPVLG
ncbi:MAG: hypothetical protein FJW88_00625 [Actinobacteria bacterium]|nr:hypothetical protein [Actinomycetota bacterium]